MLLNIKSITNNKLNRNILKSIEIDNVNILSYYKRNLRNYDTIYLFFYISILGEKNKCAKYLFNEFKFTIDTNSEFYIGLSESNKQKIKELNRTRKINKLKNNVY